MGVRNAEHVRIEERRGKRHLIIDFTYLDKRGKERRFRRDANVQTLTGARAEAKRKYTIAVTTGEVESKPSMVLSVFVEEKFKPLFLPRFRATTRVRYTALLGQGLLDELGSKRLDEIGPIEIRQFGARLAGRSVQLKGHINLLRTLLRAAVEVGELEALPAWPKLFKDSKKLPDAPSDEEVAAMLTHADDWLYVAIALAVYSGLRMSEMRALEVQDVTDVCIHVRRALSEREVTTPKSGADRDVPMCPQLAAIMRDAVRGKLPRARIVTTRKGTTPTRQLVLARFKRMLAKHGMRAWSFHALRHNFVSTLIRRGASVEATRVLAGHSSLAVTARYAHATRADTVAAIALLAGN